VAQALVDTMEVICAHTDSCDEVSGFSRIVLCASVDLTAFDVWFNSQDGYRGQYFRSPSEGLTGNRLLLDLAYAKLKSAAGNAGSVSLRALYAKAWIAEVGKGFCPKCAGAWSAPKYDQTDILNGRWEQSVEPSARFGRMAPLSTMVRLLGGFVNSHGEEYVAHRKRKRAQEIHENGWS
jgi:hypothetical protein